MKASIEVYVSVIVVVLMLMLSTCYITASLDTQYAQSYHSKVVSDIEASDFSEAVITSCKEEAAEKGFESLEVKSVLAQGNKKVAEVRLTYRYSIPLLNNFLGDESRKIVGYAR